MRQATRYNLAVCAPLHEYLKVDMPAFILDSNEQYDRSLQARALTPRRSRPPPARRRSPPSLIYFIYYAPSSPSENARVRLRGLCCVHQCETRPEHPARLRGIMRKLLHIRS